VSAEGANARDLDAASCSFFFRGYMLGHQFGPSDEVLAELRERVALLEADGGDRDEALALGYFALAWFAHWRGNVAEVAELAPRALHYARRAPLRRIGRSAMRQIGSALCHGTARWEDVERYAREEVLRQESRRADLDAVWLLAIAAGWQARFDEAASLWERQHRGLLERGLVLDAWTTGLQRGLSCMMAGRYAEAAAIYRESWDALREMKEYGYASTIGAELARALASQGRTDEARAAAHAAEAIAPPGDWVTVVSVGWARATASSADGRHDEAVALMRAALDGARQHEYLDYKTELWFAYGVILADAGRDADARAALKEALRLAELKGSTAYAVPARERLDALRART
jgi:tetratricopeptide (TPR) repeat protein